MLSLYAVTFSLSVLLLVGFIGWAVTADMQRKTDSVLAWELLYFDALTSDDVLRAVQARLDHEHTRTTYEHEHEHINYYGLFGPDGGHITGDISEMPAGLTFGDDGSTLDRTLSVMPGDRAPVVRAMAHKMKDGSVLVIARSLTGILQFRETVVKSLVIGGLACLFAGVAGGYVLSLRLCRRLKRIRRVTRRIARGDLGQRLPIGGRDELDMLAHLVNHMLDEVERLMNEVKITCDCIAHDLRTPLVHVRGLLMRMGERADALGDDVLTLLVSQACTETDILLSRFQAMLRISEIGALQRHGGFAHVQLDAIITDVGELYEPLAEHRSIRFEIERAPVEPIYGDRALLFEMFVNLIDNAIKFTPDGGAVRIELKCTPAGPRVDIVDSGIGIAPDKRDAIRKRFYRAENARHIAGSGLGLSIVSAIGRLHNFSIGIEDAQPGTRVMVECWCHGLT
ncbi:sensor histidine kinase [Burkholderia ambifaria]|uniref:histidine kinase n=1 Tax=Burkholderia ambifaria MEX-5 TaxID=396597 RepID=B1T1H4_9BURK|nr:integral membrane sensor signal transduction histidine kinase [Burkholderia ambifaria MEX-5]